MPNENPKAPKSKAYHINVSPSAEKDIYDRLEQVSDQGNYIKALIRADIEGELPIDAPEPRVIPIYFTLEAVAYPSPTFEIDFEYLETGEKAPAYADFAVKIDGDSMEPYIMDGSTVYVNRDPLADGDVGIFCLDGDMLCKQYHKDAHGVVRLLSLNRERADADRLVSDSSTLACFGRVILPHQVKVVI